MKTVQHFTLEYLEQCKQMTPEQILQFLDDFRLLFAEKAIARTTTPSAPHTLPDHPS